MIFYGDHIVNDDSFKSYFHFQANSVDQKNLPSAMPDHEVLIIGLHFDCKIILK